MLKTIFEVLPGRQLVLIFCLLPVIAAAQDQEDLVTIDDLDLILGEWQGNLTYLDYRTGSPYKMPVEATVTAGKKNNLVELRLVYPNEPEANSKTKIVVAKDGRKINKQEVVSRLITSSGEIQIMTLTTGKDDNRRATIRHTYIFGKTRFVNRKEVKFSEAEDWLLRNEYNYRRKSY